VLTTELSALRVLVVDDMAMYRRVLTETVDSSGLAGLCESAANGRIALEKLHTHMADLVLLDVEMPELGGLETLDEIRRNWPDTAVIMVSAANRSSAQITVEALQRGALDFIPKPEGDSPQHSMQELRRQLLPHMEMLATRRNLRHARGASQPLTISRAAPVRIDRPAPAVTPPTASAPAAAPFGRCQVVAIAASTGGPNALTTVLSQLPADLGVPVLVVQHMPPVFTRSLAESISRKSPLPVYEAQDGQPLVPGQILLAPGGRHMVVRCVNTQLVVGLTDGPPENGCRPAADVMFRSVAACHAQGGILGVVMTGMGRDGCEGVRAMKRRGCYCLTQSQSTCVVYGMPQAVDTQGLSDEQVDLANLAGRIRSLAKRDVP